MSDLDLVVQRLADAAMYPVRRIGGIVTKLTAAVVLVAVVSFLLGAAALDGGARTVWIVLAVVFGWIAISRAVRLRWNLAKLVRNRIALEDEIRSVVEGRPPGDPIVVHLSSPDPVDDPGHRSDDDVDSAAMEIWSREFLAGSSVSGTALQGYRWITLAVRTAKQLGLALVVSTLITVVFALMALVFLAALALS